MLFAILLDQNDEKNPELKKKVEKKHTHEIVFIRKMGEKRTYSGIILQSLHTLFLCSAFGAQYNSIQYPTGLCNATFFGFRPLIPSVSVCRWWFDGISIRFHCVAIR